MKKLEELIRTRRTVHQYRPEKVSEELVFKALELSLWAPNHRLTFPWRYTIINDDTRMKLIELAVELKRAKDPTFSLIKENALRSKLKGPSHWVALGVQKNENVQIFQEDLATLACSVQIASLYLWENEIATKWSTGGFMSQPQAYEILGLNQDEIYLMGVLFIGKADIIPHAPNRPLLEKVLNRK